MGTHIVMSHPNNRKSIVETVGGEKNFLGVYSGVALAIGAPLVYYYSKHGANQGRLLWDFSKSTPAKLLSFGLMGCAVVIMVQGSVNPSPSSAAAKHSKELGTHVAPANEPVGITRITRHGMFLSFSLIACAQLISRRTHTSDLLFWGGFPAFFLIGGWHQDYRKKVTGELPNEFYEKTSLLPFKAIVEGRNSLDLAIKEIDWTASGVGLGVFSLLYMLLPFLRRVVRK
eukprot:Phypoly_transcript_16223.p1 GENE.Phypoly_transcript_16223~~Phypoly_transcript_16223.p1  ORF type:complete len:253 (+),score=23.23 Phypoly_transcript_16223:75-761(+)